MTFRTQIDPWANSSANKDVPSAAEIAQGHGHSMVANSGWVNERSGMRDEEINAAHEAAQAASGWYPTDLNDARRMSAEWQHSQVYSTTDPNSANCRLDVAKVVVHACSGFNYTTQRGCIYFVEDGEYGEIYRLNSWDIGNLTVDTLDLDLTYITGILDIKSDGDNLYLVVTNSNTATIHLLQLSLTTWTGLALYDQDTGWTFSGGYANAKITIPRVGVIGAYYTDDAAQTAEFGVWTVGSTWATGAGTIGDVSGDVESTLQIDAELVSNYYGIFTLLRTDYSSGTVYVVGCDVDNPSTYTAVPPATIVASSHAITKPTIGLRAFRDQLHVITDSGNIATMHLITPGSWSYDTVKSAAGIGLLRSDLRNYAPVCMDGAGGIWVQYRIYSTKTISDETSLIIMKWSGELNYRAPTLGMYNAPHAYVVLDDTDELLDSKQWLLFDGRSLVSISRPGLTTALTHFRVVTNPGGR